jgi:hypothetical protein
VFTDRLLVTLVHLRTGLTHEALGVIYQVGSSTIGRAIGEIRPLLAERGFPACRALPRRGRRGGLPRRCTGGRRDRTVRIDPAVLGGQRGALRGLAEARESEQAGDVVYGADAVRALLAKRKR